MPVTIRAPTMVRLKVLPCKIVSCTQNIKQSGYVLSDHNGAGAFGGACIPNGIYAPLFMFKQIFHRAFKNI